MKQKANPSKKRRNERGSGPSCATRMVFSGAGCSARRLRLLDLHAGSALRGYEPMSSLVFYGHPESGHSYKVALALSVLELPYEYRWVDVFAPREARSADFRAASEYGEIPVLVADGVRLA